MSGPSRTTKKVLKPNSSSNASVHNRTAIKQNANKSAIHNKTVGAGALSEQEESLNFTYNKYVQSEYLKRLTAKKREEFCIVDDNQLHHYQETLDELSAEVHTKKSFKEFLRNVLKLKQDVDRLGDIVDQTKSVAESTNLETVLQEFRTDLKKIADECPVDGVRSLNKDEEFRELKIVLEKIVPIVEKCNGLVDVAAMVDLADCMVKTNAQVQTIENNLTEAQEMFLDLQLSALKEASDKLEFVCDE